MLNLIRDSLAGQYAAALGMLRSCLERADDANWIAPVGKHPFWRTAYHVQFSTDVYLSANEAAFKPPAFHVDGANYLDPPVWAPEMRVVIDPPYSKETLLGHLDAIIAKAKRSVADETEATLKGPSGFPWLPFSRLELHVYNIRHIQHHAGALAAALRRETGSGVAWMLSKPAAV